MMRVMPRMAVPTRALSVWAVPKSVSKMAMAAAMATPKRALSVWQRGGCMRVEAESSPRAWSHMPKRALADKVPDKVADKVADKAAAAAKRTVSRGDKDRGGPAGPQ